MAKLGDKEINNLARNMYNMAIENNGCCIIFCKCCIFEKQCHNLSMKPEDYSSIKQLADELREVINDCSA